MLHVLYSGPLPRFETWPNGQTSRGGRWTLKRRPAHAHHLNRDKSLQIQLLHLQQTRTGKRFRIRNGHGPNRGARGRWGCSLQAPGHIKDGLHKTPQLAIWFQQPAGYWIHKRWHIHCRCPCSRKLERIPPKISTMQIIKESRDISTSGRSSRLQRQIVRTCIGGHIIPPSHAAGSAAPFAFDRALGRRRGELSASPSLGKLGPNSSSCWGTNLVGGKETLRPTEDPEYGSMGFRLKPHSEVCAARGLTSAARPRGPARRLKLNPTALIYWSLIELHEQDCQAGSGSCCSTQARHENAGAWTPGTRVWKEISSHISFSIKAEISPSFSTNMARNALRAAADLLPEPMLPDSKAHPPPAYSKAVVLHESKPRPSQALLPPLPPLPATPPAQRRKKSVRLPHLPKLVQKGARATHSLIENILHC